MTSLFGGNPALAHFNVRLPSVWKYKDAAERDLLRHKRKEKEDKLKSLGIKTSRYFQFRVDDPKGKARAKASAEAWAKQVENQTGIAMDVCEGCFL